MSESNEGQNYTGSEFDKNLKGELLDYIPDYTRSEFNKNPRCAKWKGSLTKWKDSLTKWKDSLMSNDEKGYFEWDLLNVSAEILLFVVLMTVGLVIRDVLAERRARDFVKDQVEQIRGAVDSFSE